MKLERSRTMTNATAHGVRWVSMGATSTVDRFAVGTACIGGVVKPGYKLCILLFLFLVHPNLTLRVAIGAAVDRCVTADIHRFVTEDHDGFLDAHGESTLAKDSLDSRLLGTTIQELILGNGVEEWLGHVWAICLVGLGRFDRGIIGRGARRLGGD